MITNDVDIRTFVMIKITRFIFTNNKDKQLNIVRINTPNQIGNTLYPLNSIMTLHVKTFCYKDI